ncbi:hypothetical protein [Frankia casuarinae]|uniref:Uncharacterized protein n=1 Tax=Frankia casuarinae (strain DSM 45818 / CECT 9043 / HFP020203 / CcI3) TaxID=106370 RepID=Q2JBL0_FRACC|nr:hypothetical protein [Frankia casuarinae]ABD11332.1 hypothetical protein Francci3_1957 [Frankia casuarinae]
MSPDARNGDPPGRVWTIKQGRIPRWGRCLGGRTGDGFLIARPVRSSAAGSRLRMAFYPAGLKPLAMEALGAAIAAPDVRGTVTIHTRGCAVEATGLAVVIGLRLRAQHPKDDLGVITMGGEVPDRYDGMPGEWVPHRVRVVGTEGRARLRTGWELVPTRKIRDLAARVRRDGIRL